MYNNKENSRFEMKIRIKKTQLEWLKNNKDTKTIAGFLDTIINEYKDNLCQKKNLLKKLVKD